MVTGVLTGKADLTTNSEICGRRNLRQDGFQKSHGILLAGLLDFFSAHQPVARTLPDDARLHVDWRVRTPDTPAGKLQ
jgi:hypothetical protein